MGSKIAIFSQYLAISCKYYKIIPRLLWNVNGQLCVSDRSVWVPMTLSDLERPDARGPVSPADIHMCARSVWATAIKFGMVTLVGRDLFLRVRHAPVPGRRSFSAPIFVDHAVWSRTTNFGIITYMGTGRICRVSATRLYIAQMRRAVCQRWLSLLSRLCCQSVSLYLTCHADRQTMAR